MDSSYLELLQHVTCMQMMLSLLQRRRRGGGEGGREEVESIDAIVWFQMQSVW